jgi:hypothetical protein
MQCHRQLDHAEVGAEVPAVLSNGFDQPGADLARELVELIVREVTKVLRTGQRVEQRH